MKKATKAFAGKYPKAASQVSKVREMQAWMLKKYFTSCDPHHDIYTFCYWQIFWHSI
jgi:hypothetical protein